MRETFEALADELAGLIGPGEGFLARFLGERSDFARFNRGRTGQVGSVRQAELSVDLLEGRRHVEGSMTVCGAPAEDRARLAGLVDELRDARAHVPEDPYLTFAETRRDSEDVRRPNLPHAGDAIAHVVSSAAGRDLVGIWASGEQFAGFASATGQRNWHARSSFNLDWSLHGDDDAAVKRSLAGERFDPDVLVNDLASAGEELALLGRGRVALEPGRYRAYLAPAAVAELLALLGWGAFGLKSHRTRQTPLMRLVDGEAALAGAVDLVEDNAGGIAPAFTGNGFIKPDRVALVEAGTHRGCLVSERSAAEYGEAVNASSEFPQSLDLAPGGLARADVLDAIGDGIWISNLWYCNYSDRAEGRITGMTRFACLQVENGAAVAAFEPMRFDETVYHLLGEGLVDLTRERDLLLDSGTYGRRSMSGTRVPGLLVDGFTLTL